MAFDLDFGLQVVEMLLMISIVWLFKKRKQRNEKSEQRDGRLKNLITYRAKLLNTDWSIKRVFFLNFACKEGKITRSRLVLRLPSNTLFNREVVFL